MVFPIDKMIAFGQAPDPTLTLKDLSIPGRLSATPIFGPYFYENSDTGNAVTVTKKTDLAMLQQVFNE